MGSVWAKCYFGGLQTPCFRYELCVPVCLHFMCFLPPPIAMFTMCRLASDVSERKKEKKEGRKEGRKEGQLGQLGQNEKEERKNFRCSNLRLLLREPHAITTPAESGLKYSAQN
jgi:hypothetical protein